ncbi:hypothetical protein HDU67_007295, partial [Dinochytrium kinnereticum]
MREYGSGAKDGASFQLRKLSVQLYRPVSVHNPMKLEVSTLFASRNVRQLEVRLHDHKEGKLLARADGILTLTQNMQELSWNESQGHAEDSKNIPHFPPDEELQEAAKLTTTQNKIKTFRDTITLAVKGWENDAGWETERSMTKRPVTKEWFKPMT